MKTLKTRHQFYRPDDLSETLAALAAKPGASKTAILTDALRAWLERKAGHELDERFGPRLDRQQRIAQRSEATLNAMAEMLDLFVAKSEEHTSELQSIIRLPYAYVCLKKKN